LRLLNTLYGYDVVRDLFTNDRRYYPDLTNFVVSQYTFPVVPVFVREPGGPLISPEGWEFEAGEAEEAGEVGEAEEAGEAGEYEEEAYNEEEGLTPTPVGVPVSMAQLTSAFEAL